MTNCWFVAKIASETDLLRKIITKDTNSEDTSIGTIIDQQLIAQILVNQHSFQTSDNIDNK